MLRNTLVVLIVICILIPSLAIAAIKVEAIEYQVGPDKTTYRGYLAYDDAAKDKRPGILVCHEWWGCNDYAADRAKKLAELGYVAFALDMYGKDKVTTDPAEAGKLAGALYADPKILRDRAAAGLEVLKKDKRVDPSKLAAIGYCMGGTIALELARTGADVDAIVCFHTSNLVAKDPADNAKIKAKVLVCHGADDNFVQPGTLDTFQSQMRDAKVDCTLISYSGAVHSFTNPAADAFKIDGVKYQEAADRRSWQHMKDLFAEAFK